MKIIKTIALAISIFVCSAITVTAGEDSPVEVPGATSVNSAEAKALFDDGAAFIDVRTDADFEAGRIPGAIHLNIKSALSEDTLADEVEKDEKIVFYCNGYKCWRSSEASQMALEWGYTNVYYYREGLPAWKAAGYAVE